MPETLVKILLVEDEPAIRISMSAILTEAGYIVQLAEDGFTALSEIRRQTPDILLSDLHMAGMTGFELFSVVRRRFPTIRAVAMSGAYGGGEVPTGIAADAFYSKGGGTETLLQILRSLPDSERHSPCASSFLAPLWIHRNSDESTLEDVITIACPECLRTFTHSLGGTDGQAQETTCLHCNCRIHFAVIMPADRPAPITLHNISAETGPALKTLPQYYYY